MSVYEIEVKVPYRASLVCNVAVASHSGLLLSINWKCKVVKLHTGTSLCVKAIKSELKCITCNLKFFDTFSSL